MNTGLDPDHELLDLVRRADPMRDPRKQADAGLDTESAWRLLAPELDALAAARRSRRGRRRRSAMRIAVLAGAAAAATFVVANVASTGNGSAVSPAQAKTLIRHALAALDYPPNAIVEEDYVTTDTASDGSITTSEVHNWLSTSAPYSGRQLIIENGKVRWEQTIVNGQLDLYDPAANTVYVAPPGAPRSGDYDPNGFTVASAVRFWLGQPHVTVNPHAMIDGQPAIEFTSDGGRFTMWASPQDYTPLQMVDHDGRSVTRYPLERVLTGPAASPSLLSLQAQHPDATVDRSAADYQAAYGRLINGPVHPNARASRRRRTS